MKYLLLPILLSFSFISFADDKSDIDDLANPVIELFEKGELSKIASIALSKSSVSDYISKSDMDQTDSQFEGNFKIMGEFFSSEILHEQGIKGTFIARWYLLKFQRQPVLLHMEFYKADKKWNVHSLQMVTEIDDFIEERGRLDLGHMGSKLHK